MKNNLQISLRIFLVVAGVFGFAWPVLANPLSGSKAIKLVDGEERETVVGVIRFLSSAGKTGCEITWDDSRFGDYFLSMRPFKCLEGPAKYWCRVPYPYPNQRAVGAQDLTDLEYDPLFIWKGAREYGIDM